MCDLAQFQVGDLSYADSEYTFILESPHQQEVNYGYPAAGATGMWMSKTLFNIEIPLGKLVVTKSNHIPIISLINCSRLPLQESCYDSLELPLGYSSFLDIQKITHDNISFKKEKIKEKLKTKIGLQAIKSFRSRLLQNIVMCSNPKIIVCGVIAQCFFEESTKLQCSLRKPTQVNWEGHFISVFYEYHPSPKSGQWQKSTNMVSLLKFMS